MKEKVVQNDFGWWVCACVKRDRKKQMTHIKQNAPTILKCRKCGCTKAQHDQLAGRPQAHP